MGFFSLKVKCAICDNDTGLNRFQLSKDIWLCPTCFKKLGGIGMLPSLKKLSIDEIKEKLNTEIKTISKEYILIKVNQDLSKKYVDNAKYGLYVSLIPFNQNTQINIYTEDEKLLGEIPSDNVNEAISLGFKNRCCFS